MDTKLLELTTKRLYLRAANPSDAEDMLRYLSDPEVMKHTGMEPFETTEDVQDEIKWYHSLVKEDSGIRWGITLKETGKMIGSCGFHNREPKHFRAEIGYELSREYWGKGIASEALQAVVRYGFSHLGLERIEALIEPGNTASLRLVEKNGFLKEGLLRHYEYGRGRFDDLYMYSILKEDLAFVEEGVCDH
ncbi:ribosomal-protein-alanine N-acetyltransferase [Bhargavaea beijingensis]|uniref:Ribosomal-protein-alanine N-acetyltransferase n=1 Tax=Bhargavaea beijingensis TaxID=426756 RepID=A0A1G7B791_9BACL|nr:GNAT family N-acetyltransferase [Bhargavaea beijingensis]SDE22720.1 ribosomal-protein-alanine N-acetyltransferase [Bhargavaea beijingensis]